MIIILDHRDRYVNSISNRCVSLQDDPIILPIRKINSKFSQRCSFHPTQVAFVFFFRPPTLFLQGIRCLNQVSILLMHSLFILFFQCSYPVIFHEDAHVTSSFSFFILFLLRWIQFKLSVLIIFPSSFEVFSYVGSSLNHSPFAIQLFRSAEVIPEDSSSHSQFTQAILRLLSHSSHLIQPVHSPFQVII